MKRKPATAITIVLALMLLLSVLPAHASDDDGRLYSMLLKSILSDNIQLLEYGKLEYKELSRYPEKHYDDMVKIEGRVVQVLGDKEDGYQLRLATKGSYDDVVYIFCWNDLDFRILEDDTLTIYAKFYDIYKYETVMGGSVSLPAFVSDAVVLVD